MAMIIHIIYLLDKKHLPNNITRKVSIELMTKNSLLSEIFSHTASRHLSQMLLAIIFLHSFAFIQVASVHGRPNNTFYIPWNSRSLLNGKRYLLAIISSLLEYLFEMLFFPGLKEYWWASNSGLALVVIGELMNLIAYMTAGRAAFNSKLITHGVYGFVRHPQYLGYYMFLVGTQIMLCNPILTIVFAVFIWCFFANGISIEEKWLREHFGSQYEEYAQKTPFWVSISEVIDP